MIRSAFTVAKPHKLKLMLLKLVPKVLFILFGIWKPAIFVSFSNYLSNLVKPISLSSYSFGNLFFKSFAIEIDSKFTIVFRAFDRSRISAEVVIDEDAFVANGAVGPIMQPVVFLLQEFI